MIGRPNLFPVPTSLQNIPKPINVVKVQNLNSNLQIKNKLYRPRRGSARNQIKSGKSRMGDVA
jgi:hypothetical protein